MQRDQVDALAATSNALTAKPAWKPAVSAAGAAFPAAAERAAAESLKIARESLALGSISDLSLLNAQMTYEQALINLAQAQGNRYADTAALFQALGGGRWNRSALVSSQR